MGDHFPGKITIGGQIDQKTLPLLIEVISKEGVGVDGDYDSYASEEEIREYVHESIKTNQTITFSNAEASMGEFETLEKFCVENNLHFERHSDAKYEFDAEWVWWYPGLGEVGTAPHPDNPSEILMRFYGRLY